MSARLNFVRQQGWRDASAETCDYQYPALMWQSRALAVLVLIGLLFQSWMIAALAAQIFGRFCIGSYLFLVLTGDRRFANRTLPWVSE